ncbi:EpaQ family protein [Enterococcus faecium]|uniref:EpaQ family protein n=1 Tax=Enterococcus faecium TaxID=1352 RepID=UPI00202A93CF|nr:EpaQ family protein [Enterococcus faecium]
MDEITVIDRSLYLVVFYVFLLVTVYRVFTEIPVPEGQSIWNPSNKLSDIWINTNTIGSSLMTLALLITGFASSFGKWYMRLLSLPSVDSCWGNDLGLPIESSIICACYLHYLRNFT